MVPQLDNPFLTVAARHRSGREFSRVMTQVVDEAPMNRPRNAECPACPPHLLPIGCTAAARG